MRRFDWKVQLLVSGVTALAGGLVWLAANDAQAYPGHLALLAFCAFALLLDRSGSVLSVEAKGSTSFTVHIASGLLFGPLWAAVVTSVSTIIGLATEKQPPIKLLFNASQRVVSVTGGLLLYKWVGGGVPAAYLGRDLATAGPGVQRDLLMFVVVAVFYFLFNAGSVSAAVSLTTGRKFAEIWNVNARGVLGYDIAASYLAVMLAFLYVKFDVVPGLGSLGLVVTLVPILVIRHIYGLYRRLQSSGRELLDLMVKAIEARDPYTSGHSIRVATLAKAIAQETKMSAEEVEQVYTAAVLHDVGKIHEEFAPLLRKDSKLTPEETALLQTHSVKSADLVGIISSFRGVIQSAVRSHHERWDGGGYPDGLAGEDIPLGARIIMISDTTDAMTTDRPYRKRLPIEAVVQELQKYRGTQFDPRLVDMVVNSVTVRRVMAELQAGNPTQAGALLEGGSKRAMSGPGGLLRGRPSWPKIRAF